MNNKTENVIDSFERTQSVCIKNKILWENGSVKRTVS